MDPMTGALVSGGLKILGGFGERARQTEIAKKTYNANKLWIERDEGVATENTLYLGDEVNRELGMQLTQLGQEANRAFAKTAATTTESNIYGNTAARLQGMSKMKEALAEDNLVQAAESKMTDIQSKLTQIKYDTEARHVQNAQSYNNAINSQPSTFDILAGGVSAGIGGYSQTQQLNIQSAQLTAMGG